MAGAPGYGNASQEQDPNNQCEGLGYSFPNAGQELTPISAEGQAIEYKLGANATLGAAIQAAPKSMLKLNPLRG